MVFCGIRHSCLIGIDKTWPSQGPEMKHRETSWPLGGPKCRSERWKKSQTWIQFSHLPLTLLWPRLTQQKWDSFALKNSYLNLNQWLHNLFIISREAETAEPLCSEDLSHFQEVPIPLCWLEKKPEVSTADWGSLTSRYLIRADESQT